MTIDLIDLDQAEASIAYRTAYRVIHERMTLARLRGQAIDADALLAELADVVDISHPAARDALADCLAERPAWW
jgi:hypothetical protein